MSDHRSVSYTNSGSRAYLRDPAGEKGGLKGMKTEDTNGAGNSSSREGLSQTYWSVSEVPKQE